jgi:hypothetical protein
VPRRRVQRRRAEGERGRFEVRLRDIDSWQATWVINKTLRVSEKYDGEVELKSKPVGSFDIVLVIVVPLALYAGKRAIDLAFHEMEAYLERRRQQLRERNVRPYEYELEPYQ